MCSFFEGGFQCRDHNFITNNAIEAELHMTTLEHLAVFGQNGKCSYCNKSGLYFHNVRYIGIEKLWELVCEDCSKKIGKPANAFFDKEKSIMYGEINKLTRKKD